MWTHAILNQAIEKGHFPSEFIKAKIVLLPKGVASTDPTMYRPIALLNGMYKVIDSILKDRFTKVIDPHISKRQSAFRKNSSTHTQAFALQSIVDIAKCRNKSIHVVNLDIKKAYDSVVRSDVRELLLSIGA